MQEKLQKAMDEFISRRINDCGMADHENLQEAYGQFEEVMKTLKEVLSNEMFVDLENAYSYVDGETTNCYYRAGFADAVEFLMNWRNGEWS